MKTIPIIEIFGPTIQGEGALIGKRTAFVRVGGCDYKCKWCDTMYAVDPKQWIPRAKRMTGTEIFQKMIALRGKVPWVTISGGNPLLYDMSEFVRLCKIAHIKVAVETQGSLYKEWTQDCSLVTLSPKGPSSGHHTSTKELDQFSENMNVVFKLVIDGQDDMDYFRNLKFNYPSHKFYVQPCNWSKDVYVQLHAYKKLVERFLKLDDMNDVTILPQMHSLIWPGQEGK